MGLFRGVNKKTHHTDKGLMGSASRVIESPAELPLRMVMTDLVSKVSQLCDLTLPSQAAFIGGPTLTISRARQFCQCHFLTVLVFVGIWSAICKVYARMSDLGLVIRNLLNL